MSLGSSDRPLSEVYDTALLDLDGVVYIGAEAVPDAVDSLRTARDHGMRLAYLTNNASRTSGAVAAQLRELGVPADDVDVVTSGQAVAHLVADAVPPGSAVLLVGGDGLRRPLEDRGLRCVASLDDRPVAVVQGFHPDIGWSMLAEAAYAIETGLPWFVSNTDLTFPTARGLAPGNGSLVQAVVNATGSRPIVAGKPERALFEETIERVGATHPLMVGDRFDTDIDGAIAAGIDSLAVLSGVDSLTGLIGLEPERRPTFVGFDVTSLVSTHPAARVDGDRATCGSATATFESGTVTLSTGDAQSIEALRALVTLAWAVGDRSGREVGLDGMMGP